MTSLVEKIGIYLYSLQPKSKILAFIIAQVYLGLFKQILSLLFQTQLYLTLALNESDVLEVLKNRI